MILLPFETTGSKPQKQSRRFWRKSRLRTRAELLGAVVPPAAAAAIAAASGTVVDPTASASVSAAAAAGVIKECPNCRIFIERNDGCAQMMCRRCNHIFCWFCLAPLDVRYWFDIFS